MAKLTCAPPTRSQLEAFQKHLKRSLFVEHAAILAGIPSRSLTKWIQHGRAGHPDFVEFVDIIDNTSARQASDLMDMVMTAVSDGDVKAAQWVYKQRFAQRESALMKKWIDLEEMVEGTGASEVSDEDVAAAEARLLELAESEGDVH